MTMVGNKSKYIFDNSRLGILEMWADPNTIRHLEGLGVNACVPNFKEGCCF